MERNSHPPVRERAPFDEADMTAIGEDTYMLHATGVMGFQPAEIAVEPIDEAGIPEPTWARYEVVAYHWGDSKPGSHQYEVGKELTLPPGAVGVELVGANKTEQLPVIFDREER
jgi:hypothetical protein